MYVHGLTAAGPRNQGDMLRLSFRDLSIATTNPRRRARFGEGLFIILSKCPMVECIFEVIAY